MNTNVLPSDRYVIEAFTEILTDVENLMHAATGRTEIAYWRQRADILHSVLDRATELEDLAIDALADRAAAADILADAQDLRAELAHDGPPHRPLGARLAEARMRYAA